MLEIMTDIKLYAFEDDDIVHCELRRENVLLRVQQGDCDPINVRITWAELQQLLDLKKNVGL